MTPFFSDIWQSLKRGGTVRTIVILCLLTALLRDQPGFTYLFVPFRTFDAFIHESGHALVCVLTGGTVESMELGLGGVTDCIGGNKVAIALAGYLVQALIGSLLIILCRNKDYAKKILMAIAVFIGIGDLLFFRERFAGTWALLAGITVFWIGWKSSREVAYVIVLMLAIQTVLNIAFDMNVIFMHAVGMAPGVAQSDATHLAQLTGTPAVIWAALWGAFSILCLAGSLFSIRRPSVVAATQVALPES